MTVIFLVVGLLFIAVGIFFIRDHKIFLITARKANGNVVAVEKYESTNSDNETTTYYRPIIDFTANNDNYRLTSSMGSGAITHEIGQRVPLLYMSDNPKDARLDGPAQYILGVVLTALGLGACSVYVFTHINDGFAWWDGVIAILVIGFLFIKARKFMKLAGVTSIDDIKREFKKAKKESGDAAIIGSKDDPFFDSTRIFYKNRKEFKAEKGKLEFSGKIINLVFLLVGCTLAYFGWEIYQEESASSSPDMIKQYALLGMGSFFVLAALLNFLKSGSNVKRV